MQVKVRRRLGLALSAFSLVAMVWGISQDLPYVIEKPGKAFNVLGNFDGKEVIQIGSGSLVDNPGKLDLMTISVWGSPGNTPKIFDLFEPFFATDKSVVPLEEYYPLGQTPEEAERASLKDFADSQLAATSAAKRYLPDEISRNLDVKLQLAGIGGPSGGLMFTLGIIDKALPESLTGGKNIAGTGTISADGSVGAIGGIDFKMIAAVRAGDRFFLAPSVNCPNVVGHIPGALKVFAVSNVQDALNALKVISSDGDVSKLPVCSAK